MNAGRQLAGRALRAMVAGAGLLGLSVGFPLFLVAAAGSPVPSEMPSWSEVEAALTRRDDGTLMLQILRYLAWTLWAAWVLMLVLETAAQVRGRTAFRVRGFGGPQRLATLLLTSLGGTLVASVSVNRTLPPPATVTIAAAPPASASQAEDESRQRQDVTVRFSFDSDHLSDAAARALERAAKDIRARGDPHRAVIVTGHADSVGAAEYNQRLSERRARAVRDELQHTLGSRYRFQVRGKGETEPLSADRSEGRDNPLARARNRRAEITYAVLAHAPGRTASPPAPATPTPVPTSAQQPSPSPPSAHDTDAPSVLVSLPAGGLVGISFAAGIGTALLASRLHRRRLHRVSPSGSDTAKTEPDPPPSVQTLRRAELARQESGERNPAQVCDEGQALLLYPLLSNGKITIGVRDDAEVTVPLAGLTAGLTGPGATDTARAILLGAMTHAGHFDVELLLPETTAVQLLAMSTAEVDEIAARVQPLTIAPDLDTALRRIDSETVHRARLMDALDEPADLDAVRQADPGEPLPRLVLITADSERHRHRLETLCASAREYDISIAGVGELPGATIVSLDAQGVVTAADGPSARTWEGVRAYHVSAAEGQEMLAVIRGAHGAPEPAPDLEPSPVVPPAQTECPAHLRVLGPPTVDIAGQEVTTGIGTNGYALLVYLALRPDGVSRDAISADLWPDVDKRRATMRFHVTLRDVRRTLRGATGAEEADFITAAPNLYRLDPKLISVDLWRFQHALHDASGTDDDRRRIDLFQEAADLYRGDLAARESYEWIEPERETQRLHLIEALIRLAELVEPSDPDRALAALERATTLDPYAEQAFQQTMYILARLKRYDAVRRAYRLLENNLSELGAEPGDETRTLLWRLLEENRKVQSRKQ